MLSVLLSVWNFIILLKLKDTVRVVFGLSSCCFVVKQNNPAVGMTKRSYMESVKAGMDLAAPSSPIHVRLIPSIDRKETTEAAMDTVSSTVFKYIFWNLLQ